MKEWNSAVDSKTTVRAGGEQDLFSGGLEDNGKIFVVS